MIKHLFFFLSISVSIAGMAGCGSNHSKQMAANKIDSLGKLNPELARLSTQINESPTKADLYFARGTVFFQMEMMNEAAKDLHQAIELDSTKTAYYLTFADINVAARYLQVAVEYLKRAKKIEPDNKEINIKLAKVYLYLKEYDEAIAETNLVLSKDKMDDRCNMLQGLIYKEKGDTAKAIKTFQLAVENNPDSYDAYMQLGLLCEKKHDAKAEKYFLNAIRIDTAKYEGMYALAMYYQNRNETKKAISTYIKLITQSPQSPQPIYNLGYIYYHLDSVKLAYNHFTMLMQTDPSNADAYYMRGLCNLKRNYADEARTDFSQAINLRPDFAEAKEEFNKLIKK